MAESCKENCPILAMALGQKETLRFIDKTSQEKYLSTLDVMQSAGQVTEGSEDLAFAIGQEVAGVSDLVENIAPVVDELRENAVTLCPGLEVKSGRTTGSCIIKCGGFSVRALTKLVESQTTLIRTAELIHDGPDPKTS